MLLTYNITSLDSFSNMDYWHNEFKSQSEPDALVYLIGNKSDQADQREVPVDKAEQFRLIK